VSKISAPSRLTTRHPLQVRAREADRYVLVLAPYAAEDHPRAPCFELAQQRSHRRCLRYQWPVADWQIGTDHTAVTVYEAIPKALHAICEHPTADIRGVD
jgi:hypothetical protein